MERGPIPASRRLRLCSVYLPSVRAFRLSRRIDDMKRAGNVASVHVAEDELAHLLADREFAEDVLSRERGGD